MYSMLACGGELPASGGLIRPIMGGVNYTSLQVCHWWYANPDAAPGAANGAGSTTVFKAPKVLIEKTSSSGGCYYDYIAFLAGAYSMYTFVEKCVLCYFGRFGDRRPTYIHDTHAVRTKHTCQKSPINYAILRKWCLILTAMSIFLVRLLDRADGNPEHSSLTIPALTYGVWRAELIPLCLKSSKI